MGQAQINVRTRACSGTFIARTKQAALTHNVRGKELIHIVPIDLISFYTRRTIPVARSSSKMIWTQEFITGFSTIH